MLEGQLCSLPRPSSSRLIIRSIIAVVEAGVRKVPNQLQGGKDADLGGNPRGVGIEDRAVSAISPGRQPRAPARSSPDPAQVIFSSASRVAWESADSLSWSIRWAIIAQDSVYTASSKPLFSSHGLACQSASSTAAATTRRSRCFSSKIWVR